MNQVPKQDTSIIFDTRIKNKDIYIETINFFTRELLNKQDTEYDFWRFRAINLVNSVFPAIFIHLNNESFSAEKLFDNLKLDKIVYIYNDESTPSDVKQNIYSFLESLPRFNLRKAKQHETTVSQFSFVSAYLVAIKDQYSDYILRHELLLKGLGALNHQQSSLNVNQLKGDRIKQNTI